MRTLLIIDTSSYMHKAYHGYSMRYKKNWVAIGLATQFKKLFDEYQPQLVVSCEDTRDNSFIRRVLYAEYKNGRVGKSSDTTMQEQFGLGRDFLEATGITRIAMNGYEADDVIAAIVKKFKGTEDLRIVIVTGDKDMSQLVDSKNSVEVHLNNGRGNTGLKYEMLVHEDDVVEKYGVLPVNIPELFGLIGDVNDGIPGVAHMNEPVAIDLVNTYDTLEEIYKNIDELDEHTRNVLRTGKEMAFKSRQLATPLPVDIEHTLGAFIKNPDIRPIVKFGLDVEPLILKLYGLESIHSMSKLNEMYALVNYLNACSKEYYKYGVSPISDVEFDRMLEKLKLLEEALNYRDDKSPTMHVGSDNDEFGIPIKHIVPMLSLDNSYSADELLKFMEGIQKQYDNLDVIFETEWKWDGMSISLEYENGMLVRALTRGDGIHGEDVTTNIKVISGVPRLVPDESFTNIVRGECLISHSDFAIINTERRSEGLDEFANPRNAASIIRSGKDIVEVKKRRMQFMAFKIVNSTVNSDEDKLELKRLGFNTSSTLCTMVYGKTDVKSVISKYDAERKNLNYPTDGLVVSVTYKKIREELGEGVKFPRWAKAYKFNPEGALSKLLNVTWQVGKFGTLTPVATIEPVEIAGSTISRATLHNYDNILSKGIKLYDTLHVVKSAEVIPRVESVYSTSSESKTIYPPKECPVCGGVVEEDGASLKCSNEDCPDRIRARLAHVASKGILDMDGFGPSVVSMLYERGVRTTKDLLDKSFLNGLEHEDGYGFQSKEILVKAIDKVIAGTELYRVVASLLIEGVGRTMSKKLAEVNTVESILSGNIEFNPTIGPKAKESIINGLTSPEGIKELTDILSILKIVNTLNNRKSSKFAGKTFCISGNLPTTKDKLERMIRENGGMMISGVSKNLSYLICQDMSNSKPQKAMKIGVSVISYEEFMKLLKA